MPGLTFYYWDHACNNRHDKEQCSDISLNMQPTDRLEPVQVARWATGFEEDWQIIYQADTIAKLHVVVRKGVGIAMGPEDPIVAHAVVAFVTDEFTEYLENCDDNRKAGNRTRLGAFPERGPSPILSEGDVLAVQGSDIGLTAWCPLLHWKHGEDGIAVRKQLEAGLMWELRRYRLERVMMEATRFKGEIWMFGLLPYIKGETIGDLDSRLMQELKSDTRTLFSISRTNIAEDKLRVSRNVAMLFRYRKPDVELKDEQKRALSLWFRYGKHVPTVEAMLSKRNMRWADSTIADHISQARRALGLHKEDLNMNDSYSLEKLIEGYPELLGPYPGE